MTKHDLNGAAVHQALSFESVRADIAHVLHEEPEMIGEDDSLIELGLDSIRAMSLVTRWRNTGIDITFSEFAVTPSLRHWWSLICQAQQRA